MLTPVVTPIARPLGRAFEATKLRIFERDGWRCQVQLDGCIGSVTQVDRVVPLAEGGRDIDSNLRASCTRCCQARGGG